VKPPGRLSRQGSGQGYTRLLRGKRSTEVQWKLSSQSGSRLLPLKKQQTRLGNVVIDKTHINTGIGVSSTVGI
jgi:hypothetical protein